MDIGKRIEPDDAEKEQAERRREAEEDDWWDDPEDAGLDRDYEEMDTGD